MRFSEPVRRAGAYATSWGIVTLRCYDAQGGLLGTASLPGPNLNRARYAYSPNYPLFVDTTGIASCSFTGPRLGYALDDFTFSRGQSTLSLGRDSVGPVLANWFNAVTQAASTRQGGPAMARLDTVRVTVGGAARDTLWVVSAPDSTSGGHAHDLGARPRGTFFTLEQLGTISLARGGQRDSLRITLPDSGTLTLIYRTSGIGGVEWLKLRRPSALAGESADSAGITVRHAGLVEMPRDGTRYYFSDQTPASGSRRHGNRNNWVAPGFRDNVLATFKSYFDTIPAGHRFVGGEARFVITDAGLMYGGLFDVDGSGAWHNPHQLHRTGEDIDVRHRTMNAFQDQKFLRACELTNVTCEVHQPLHWHVRR